MPDKAITSQGVPALTNGRESFTQTTELGVQGRDAARTGKLGVIEDAIGDTEEEVRFGALMCVANRQPEAYAR